MSQDNQSGEQANFNREVERLLDRSESRVKELRDYSRPDWNNLEKWHIDRRLTELETQKSWDREWLERRLQSAEKELISLYLFFFILLFLFLLFAGILTIRLVHFWPHPI